MAASKHKKDSPPSGKQPDKVQVKILKKLTNGRFLVSDPTGHTRLADRDDLEVQAWLWGTGK